MNDKAREEQYDRPGHKPYPTEPKPDARPVPTSQPVVNFSIAQPAHTDREIQHAAALSAVLRDMRRDLGRDGVKRVMLFVMERWGIHAIVGIGLLVDDQIPDYTTSNPEVAPTEVAPTEVAPF